MRLIDADALLEVARGHLSLFDSCPGKIGLTDKIRRDEIQNSIADILNAPTVAASPWHRVEAELPKEAGEYIVAYHPCWWNDVKTSVTEIGIDTFRGKTSWAKRKFQRVTHWMEKPEPPKEDA